MRKQLWMGFLVLVLALGMAGTVTLVDSMKGACFELWLPGSNDE